LPQILDKIKTNTQGWTKEQKASAIAMAFGTEAQAGMNALVSQGGDALSDLTDKTEKATGSTKKIADTMNNTASANMSKFKESMNVLAITIGSKLMPTITPMIKKITDLVKSFAKLSPQTKDFILKAALITAAVGPVLLILSQLITVIMGVITALTFLAAHPVVLVVAAIAAIGIGLVEAYKHIKPFHDAVNNLFNALKTFFVNIGKWFSELPGKVQAGFSGMSQWIGQIPGKFKSAFAGMTDWGSQLTAGLKKSWSGVTSVTSKWATEFKKVGKKMLDALVGVLKGFGKLAVYALALPVGIAVLITKPLVQPLKNIMKALIAAIKAIWAPYKTWLINFWKNLFQFLKVILTQISNFFRQIFTTLSNWFKQIMSGISNTWRSSWTSIGNFFRPILSSISNFFRATFNSIKVFFSGVMNSLSNITSSVLGVISNIWHSSITGISNFFKSIMNGIVNFAKPIMNSLSNVISSALSAISSTWNKMWQNMADFFGGILDELNIFLALKCNFENVQFF